MDHQVSIAGHNDAVTRLEAAIILIAFVVAAALVTYFIVKAGFF